MIPATNTDVEMFRKMCSRADYGRDMVQHIAPYAMDPIPPVNAKGGRGVEGWRVVFSADVPKEWGNSLGGMHGAAHAWLVDNLTSAALFMISTDTFWGGRMAGGVSLSIDMSYYAPAKVGSKIRIVVMIERISATLANLRCDISDWDTGKRLSSGTHLKTWRAAPKL